MIRSFEFLKKVIDSISEHIAVIDEQGVIRFTNRAWNNFGRANGCSIADDWIGINYLLVCDNAGKKGDEYGEKASLGIRSVINGAASFSLEYPCHSPTDKRWFMMSTTTFEHHQRMFFIISHANITKRKLAEEYALSLSRIDGLTSLFNRRHFDAFFAEEWRRCSRLRLPITLAMMDIDHFKLLNDTYGHQYGDECLKKIATVLKKFAKRPGDISARYGGEEFVLVFGNSTVEKILPILHKLKAEIIDLNLPNKSSPTLPYVTITIGVATTYPSQESEKESLLEKADMLLYKGKANGRNRIEY
jgi:diguanylate cyclase (GGDEF)-like protein